MIHNLLLNKNLSIAVTPHVLYFIECIFTFKMDIISSPLSSSNGRCYHHLILLSIQEKKPKPLVSPNHFTVLASEEDNEIEFVTFCDVPNVINKSIIYHQCNNIRTSSMYVQSINNFSAFKNTLVKITGSNVFKCKSLSSFLIVRLHGRLNFNAITEHLMATNTYFHS